MEHNFKIVTPLKIDEIFKEIQLKEHLLKVSIFEDDQEFIIRGKIFKVFGKCSESTKDTVILIDIIEDRTVKMGQDSFFLTIGCIAISILPVMFLGIPLVLGFNLPSELSLALIFSPPSLVLIFLVLILTILFSSMNKPSGLVLLGNTADQIANSLAKMLKSEAIESLH